MTPSQEEREALQQRQDSLMKIQRQQDSLELVRQFQQLKMDSVAAAEETKAQTLPTESEATVSAVSQEQIDKLGVFANAATGENKIYYLENERYKIGISTEGGKVISVQLKNFQTFDSLPLILFEPNTTNFGLSFFANNRLINTNELFFKPSTTEPISVTGDQTKEFAMRLYVGTDDSTLNNDRYLEYRYTIRGKDYMLGFDVRFVGLEEYMDRGTSYVDLAWNTELNQLEKGRDRFNGPTIYYKFHEDDVDYLSEQKDDEEELVNRLKWISFTHRFFSSTLIADDFLLNANVKVFELEEGQRDHYLRSMEMETALPFSAGAVSEIPMSFYFGPNKFKTLRKYKLDLERQIPLGWSFFLMQWINRFAVIPVFNFLEGFGWNYGIIILVLTVMLKIVLFPIAYRSYISSARMRVLKPEIEELGKKFPKKEEAMKKQQATMNLYKQAGVNPMAGCIPMLLQFPILIAMFRFFPSAIELRQQSFLWADDLSSYDSILDLGFEIPFYGDHVSLFTLLMTVSTLIYTRMNQDMMGSQQQMPGMKTMMYLMPIMFLGLFNNYASGLSYYYFLANVMTFAQMYFIRRSINEDKIRKKIELNKKKPKKKSNWQKRLEDAAKQRGYKAPKR
jgi:YidC/Oxa1 family membrane protein insertase